MLFLAVFCGISGRKITGISHVQKIEKAYILSLVEELTKTDTTTLQLVIFLFEKKKVF